MTQRALRIGITCYPTIGGSGIVATELGRSLAQRGHDVHFICYDLPGRLDPATDGVTFHRVPLRDYPLPHLGTYTLALASQLAEVSAGAELDLLHLHYAIPHATSAYLAGQLLRESGRRLPRTITTLHGTDVTQVGSDPALLPLHRFALRHCDGLTVPSQYLQQAAYAELGLPATPAIAVIPNFVDSQLYCPPAEPQRRWETLAPLLERPLPAALAAEARVLIHSSNFRPVKRIGDVVQVFAEVHKQLPAILLLIGDGPERPRIEALVRELGLAESVYFLGAQREFLPALQHSDVFLLPSSSEGFGLSALEALSCGVPVVASRVGGLPEVIADGRTGILCPTEDTAGMTAAVLRLLQDPERRRQMGRAARASVEGNWQKEPVIRRYEDYYRQVLRA